jgi:hypothetical protein
MRSTVVVILLAAALAGTIGCGKPAPPLDQQIQATVVGTGWYDAGIENGKNKLSPTITLVLKNIGDEPLRSLQLNAVFRRVGETEEWGGAYVQVAGSDGLAPGAQTRPIVLRSQLGYTGTEPRAQMLKNRLFLDVGVQVFAKRAALQWAKLGEWPINRELIYR